MNVYKLNFVLAAAVAVVCAAPAFTNSTIAASADADRLIAILGSGASQKEKADACRELARVGGRNAVAPLAALLGDEQLSHMARYALEVIPDSAVDDALRAALGTVSGRPLAGVIASIGVRRDAKAVQPLARLLVHADADVAQAAARALGDIGNVAAARALQDAWPRVPAASQLALCEGLFRCAESLAENRSPKEAIAIYDLLCTSGRAHQVRAGAWRGAILTREKRNALPLLREGLASSDFVVVAACARAAQQMSGSDITRALCSELERASADKQILLIQTLGVRGDTGAMKALSAIAKSGEPAVRVAAILALAEFQEPAAIPVLVALVRADDNAVAQAAREALASVPGRKADGAVMTLFRSRNQADRLVALELLARRRMTGAIPELFKAAENADAELRVASLQKIGELAGPDDVPALLKLLARANDTAAIEPVERSLNAVCLNAPAPQACAKPLADAMSSATPIQKAALLRLLGAVGGDTALTSVRAAINDSDAQVRSVAVRALSSWATVDAAPHLLELARNAASGTDKMLCLRGYLRLAGQAELPAEQRLEMCRQASGLIQRPEEKKLFLGTLGGIVAPGALALIAPYLDDPTTRDEAALAAVGVSEKLLKDRAAAKSASTLIEPLQKVAAQTGNAELSKRAKSLLEQAQIKAAAK